MASRYIIQLRRGTAEEWATIGKDIVPLEGELVLEIDKSGNNLHRLKIGDGTSLYEALPYLSVDNFIFPKQEFVRLSTQWSVASDNRYFQEVVVDNAVITSHSKVDLNPTSEMLAIFHEKDLAFVAENEGGVVRVYCVGQVPQNSYDIPVTVTEIITDKTVIIGNTTATPNPISDWNQTDPKKADYIKNKPDIEALQKQIDDIRYEPISITSFTHNAGTKEMGQTVTDVTLSWKVNKTPTSLTLDGALVDANITSKTISGLSVTWNNNKTWTLVATDDRNAESTKTTSITFCNGIYYGVGTIKSNFDSAFVTGLNKRLQTSKAYDFTVNPSAQYIYYAVPKRLGTVSFKVGGFEGGFEAPEIVSVTNSSSYTEDYYVYRSTNPITGSTAVDVI